MTQFAVLHIEKNKGSQIGLSKHISRETIPANADPSRLYLNETPVGSRNQMQDIKDRIKEGVTQKTAIRKDAVKAMQIILTGSHEQMKVIESNGLLKDWMKQNISWLDKTFGKANVVNVTLHMDELTPHVHATVVPITSDGRLCAKDFMSKEHLKGYQTSYAKAMEPFGLSRGLEGSRAKHQDVKQYYAKLNYELPKINKEIEEKQETVKVLKNEIRVDTAWKTVTGIVDGFAKRKENKDKEDEIASLKKTAEQLSIDLNNLQKEFAKSKLELNNTKKEFSTLHAEIDKSMQEGLKQAVHTINHLIYSQIEKPLFQFELIYKKEKPVIELKLIKPTNHVPTVEEIMGKNVRKRNLERL